MAASADQAAWITPGQPDDAPELALRDLALDDKQHLS